MNPKHLAALVPAPFFALPPAMRGLYLAKGGSYLLLEIDGGFQPLTHHHDHQRNP